MKTKLFKKLVSFFLSLSLLANSVSAPLLVLAEGETPSPTPTDTPIPTPTSDPTQTPSPTPSESPTSIPTETPSPTPKPPLNSEQEVLPDQTVNTDSSNQTTNENAQPQAPPDDSQEPAINEAITTPVQPIEKGDLSTRIVQEGESYSIEIQSYDSYTVTTDKLDYAPTDTAIITGTSFTVGETYSLTVSSTDEPATSATVSVTADANGEFVYAYQLDGNYRPNYAVEVKSGEVVVASTTFTDAASVNAAIDQYSQCSNDDGDGYSTGDTGCRWINGNLQNTNSTYYESDATVQRLAIKDLTTGDHTVTIKYGTTKGGNHAYDFITDDKFSESWIADADMCDAPLDELASCSSLTPVDSGLIPTDTNAAGYDTATSSRHFRIRNGTWSNTGTIVSGIATGPTLVSGSYAGDSETTIQLKFHVDSATCANSYDAVGGPDIVMACEVLITFGAHVSSQLDWGVGTSAVNIDGSPYHVSLEELDGGSAGSLDHQMQASAIVIPGTITVIKNVEPSDSSAWDFTLAGPDSYSENANDILDGGQYQFISLTPGDYTLSEITDPNYSASVSCDSEESGTDSVSINLAEDEDVVCTFTNTINTGLVTVHKLVDTDGNGTFEGGNTEANTLGFDWGLDAETPARDMGTTATGVLTGAHTVTEDNSVTDYHFVGWFPGNPNSTQYSCTNLPAGEQTTTVDVNVTDDQTTEVTFCNARDTGTIVIIKDANPNSENDFTFDTDLPGVGGVFDLEDDGDDNNGGTEESITFNVPTGSYSVDEQDEPGWELTNLECSDENNSDTDPGGLAEITLDINETVTCTYTNTQLGSISGSKFEDLDGILGGTQNPVSNWAIQLWKWIIDSWSFQDSTTTNGSGFYSFSNLLPGLYQIREGTEVGWTNMSPLVIQEDLSAGEVSTENDFVNTQYGSITVYKNVDFNGDGDLDDAEIDAIQAPGWTWDIDGAGNYSASFGENTVGDLLPGTYTISEDQQAGYHVIGLVCDGETNYGAVESQEISLSSNQDLVCTFTNSRDTGTIVILKDAINNSENNFTFDTDMPGVGGVFDLEDDGDDNNGGTDEQITFNIPIGTYWVDERDETGWELTNLECSDENNSDTDPDGRADITLDTNETVTCTYTNTELGNVTVVKYNDHNGNGIKDDGDETLDGWEIWLDEMAQWTGAQVAGQVTFSDLLPGSFTLSEQENEPDWVQTNIACGDEEGIDADNSHPVELAAGQDLTCYIGNQGRGSITVYKNVDFNGDGDLDDAEIDAIQAPGWTWDIDGAGNYSASFGENTVGVPAGSHTISEDQQTDYHVISLVCGETNYGAVESQEIALNPGDDLVCTFTNSRDTGDLEVTKYNDLDGNGQQDPGEGVLAGWEINVENQTSQLTDVNGQAFFNGLVTGSYELSETEQTGWTQTNISCQVGDSNEAGVLEDDEYYANIESDQTTHCLIGNIRDTGNITVDKVTDPSEDPTEFTINLTGESTHDFVLSDTDSPETIAVPTGSYSLNEVAPGGWELSSVECERIVGEGTIGLDESNFEVGSGHNISCTVTNREIVLGVTIEKSNNKPNTNAGDTVAYTLLITNTGNQTIFGLDVVDILPGGFSYVSGTTTGATTSDPTVAGNKLTWENVTNLGAGDSLTIEYQVKIANDATNGIYTNFATCSGLGGRQEDPVECNQDDSSVTLGSGTSFGGNLVGQVLGASTELPATGTPTALLLLSLGLLGTGLYLRKKHAKN